MSLHPPIGNLGGGAVLMTAALTLVVGALFKLLKRNQAEKHLRGVMLIDGSAMQRQSARRRKGGSDTLTIAGIQITTADETKHFKLIGTTGTGKSSAIRELLGGAIARGDRAVFADPDGAYLNSFFRRYRGDILLNPFERDSARWDLFAEIKDAYDVEQLVAGLIPNSDDPSAAEWRGYARTFLSAVVQRCLLEQRREVGDLWRLLTVASPDELRLLVAGTPAQPFLDPDNARMFGSIRSVTGSAVAALKYIQLQRGTPFSVRRWVRDARESNLFIPYRANQIAALRSMIATWVRLAIFESMSQPLQRDQRLWFVVDELDALGAIDGLKDALARLRKFGARCVLGFQSIAQVSSTYGKGEAQTIVENCGNTLVLRCSGSEDGGTSQFASRLIGDREVVRRQLSRGRDSDSGLASRGARRSRNVTEQHVIEAAVMASELEQLPDLSGYFKAASSPAWLKVSFGN